MGTRITRWKFVSDGRQTAKLSSDDVPLLPVLDLFLDRSKFPRCFRESASFDTWIEEAEILLFVCVLSSFPHASTAHFLLMGRWMDD